MDTGRGGVVGFAVARGFDAVDELRERGTIGALETEVLDLVRRSLFVGMMVEGVPWEKAKWNCRER
jgi:hypothetical protein